jgi:hypothetical protein
MQRIRPGFCSLEEPRGRLAVLFSEIRYKLNI